MEQATLNSIGLSLFGAVMTFGATWFWFLRNAALRRAEVLAADHAETVARVTELEAKIRLTEQVITPITTAFQALLVKSLTHSDRVELDRLLEKLGPPVILTDEERDRLHVMLIERSEDMSPDISTSEREAAQILPIVMKMAVEEQQNFTASQSGTTLNLVTIVSVLATDGTTSSATPKADQEETRLPDRRGTRAEVSTL